MNAARTMLIAGLVLATTACARPAHTQTPAPQASPIPERQRPVIQTSSSAQVNVTPDRAAITLGVMTRGANVTQATAENARIQRAVIEAVRRMDIPAERIMTTGFHVSPVYRHDPRGQEEPRITGYSVNNTIRVEVHQLDRIGAIIDAGLGAGANNMHGLQFWSSNTDEARRRALDEAVRRARADAEAMARSAGGQLGALEALQYGFVPDVRPMQEMAMMRAAAADATPIAVGEQTLSVTVTGRWLFVGGQ